MQLYQYLVFFIMFLTTTASASSNDTSTLQLLYKTLEKCGSDSDMTLCLKVKTVNFLNRALSMESNPIGDFVTITKDPQAKDVPLTATEVLEQNLPRDLGQKSSALDKMIQERIEKYLETRKIQLNIPKGIFEGRGRKGSKGGKGSGMLIVLGAFIAALVQLALGKLALIAGKALLVGKVALLLAGVIGLKSLVSQRHHETSQVIYADVGDHHHAGWGRSIDKNGAQDLVYRGQRPANHVTSSTNHRSRQ